jgi:hypothetical protein
MFPTRCSGFYELHLCSLAQIPRGLWLRHIQCCSYMQSEVFTSRWHLRCGSNFVYFRFQKDGLSRTFCSSKSRINNSPALNSCDTDPRIIGNDGELIGIRILLRFWDPEPYISRTKPRIPLVSSDRVDIKSRIKETMKNSPRYIYPSPSRFLTIYLQNEIADCPRLFIHLKRHLIALKSSQEWYHFKASCHSHAQITI